MLLVFLLARYIIFEGKLVTTDFGEWLSILKDDIAVGTVDTDVVRAPLAKRTEPDGIFCLDGVYQMIGEVCYFYDRFTNEPQKEIKAVDVLIDEAATIVADGTAPISGAIVLG